jgi:hypothetical protein
MRSPWVSVLAGPKYDLDALKSISMGSVTDGAPKCGIMGPTSVGTCMVQPNPCCTWVVAVEAFKAMPNMVVKVLYGTGDGAGDGEPGGHGI